MKFDIKSRFNGEVIFTAEIEAGEDVPHSIKLGLAVMVARKTGADLNGASLNWASLNGANLSRANLNWASLDGASLNRANLNGADLNGADLNGADLNGASLNGANLSRANLSRASGINDWIKCIQIGDWPITYTSDVMQIGCQRHSLDEWRNFADAEIIRMDGRLALAFWRKWKAWIFQTIEMAPARPTGATPGMGEGGEK